MIIYVHDVQAEVSGAVAANKRNIDTVERIRQLLLCRRDIMLTADDGYRSIHKLLPIIEKNNTKLVLFITTGFVEKTVYPYEVELSNLLEKNAALIYKGKKEKAEVDSEKDRLFDIVHHELKNKTEKQREMEMDKLAEENGYVRSVYQEDKFLDWGLLTQLARHPNVEIGSHSVSHVLLPAQSITTIWEELAWSKKMLEKKLNTEVTKLSYPYGAADTRVKCVAKACGYQRAYGTDCEKSGWMNIARRRLVDAL